MTKLTKILLGLILLWALFAVAFSLLSAANASPACMTMQEARKAFPDAHLWWHGSNKCWDAHAKHAPAPARKHVDPVPAAHARVVDANGNQATPAVSKVVIYYPELVSGSLNDDIVMRTRAQPITGWGVPLDVDVEPIHASPITPDPQLVSLLQTDIRAAEDFNEIDAMAPPLPEKPMRHTWTIVTLLGSVSLMGGLFSMMINRRRVYVVKDV